MDVARILAMGKRWWWLIIIGALFSVAAYGVTSRLRGASHQTPTYSATTTLFATLPPLSDAALASDATKRPWELDRLMATYAQIAKSRTVAERAISDADLTTTADDLASRIDASTFGYTQLLRINVSAISPADADRSLAAVVRAFGEIRAERTIPGDTAVYETFPATRSDHPIPELVNIAIVVLAGVLAAVAIVLVFEYAGGGAATNIESETRIASQATGVAGRAPSANERAA